MITIFRGATVDIKVIKKVNGNIAYGLYRPYDQRKSTFAEYNNSDEAIFIAQFIEQHNGEFHAEVRLAARRYWRQHADHSCSP
jgi:hypothetical protein